MQRILVDKRLLDQKIAEMSGGVRLLELCIVPSQEDAEQIGPAFLHLGGIYQDGTYEDFESIDESAVSCCVIRKSA